MDFDKLYNTYYMEIYSYVMTLIRNAHSAEEITQEVFFKAFKTEKNIAAIPVNLHGSAPLPRIPASTNYGKLQKPEK